MKRAISIILCVILILTAIVGCGGKQGTKPSDISEAYYQYGLKGLAIADEYLTFTSSAEDVYPRIDDLFKTGQDMIGEDYDDEDPEVKIVTGVGSLDIFLGGVTVDGDAAYYDMVLLARNNLAEMLNEPEVGE